MPRELAQTFTLLLAPFAPHLAEEIWSGLSREQSLARHPWPKFDPAKLTDATMELAVQVNGRLRGTVTVPADAAKDAVVQAARQVPNVQPHLAGKTVVKELYVEKKLVNFVVR